MDTAHPQKYLFILDRNLAKANCTEDGVCTSCDIVAFDIYILNTHFRMFDSVKRYLHISA